MIRTVGDLREFLDQFDDAAEVRLASVGHRIGERLRRALHGGAE